MEPLGVRMLIGCVVGRRLMTGDAIRKKLLVLPVSAMMLLVVGGPTVGTMLGIDDSSLEEEASIHRVVAGVGFPPSQVGAGVRRRKPDEMVLLPPCILSAVAVALWPSFGCSHVALV